LKELFQFINSGFLVQIQHIPPRWKIWRTNSKGKGNIVAFFEGCSYRRFIATPERQDFCKCNPSIAELYGFQNIEEASKSKYVPVQLRDWENLERKREPGN
jgi:hypothetical protein